MTATTSIVCKSCGCESQSVTYCDICGSEFVAFTLEVAVSMMVEAVPVPVETREEHRFSRYLSRTECTESQYEIYRTLYYGETWNVTEAKMIGRKLFLTLESRKNVGDTFTDRKVYGTIGVRGKIELKGQAFAYYPEIDSMEKLASFAR